MPTTQHGNGKAAANSNAPFLATHVCPECDGRGFHWKDGHIFSRHDGSVVADIKTRGDMCVRCWGDGHYHRANMPAGPIIKGVLLGLFILGCIALLLVGAG